MRTAHGIRVNAVAPAPTPMMAMSVLERLDTRTVWTSCTARASRIPPAQTAAPEDVVAAVLVASSDAKHLTGVVIPVDGGLLLS